MSQKVTLLFKEENVNFAKKEARRRGTSMSKMMDEYLDLLKKIDKKMKSEKLHPYVKEVGGMINTGKNERVR
jgi:hypothetical protein